MFRALQPQRRSSSDGEFRGATFRCEVEISERNCVSVMELKSGVGPPWNSLPLAYMQLFVTPS